MQQVKLSEELETISCVHTHIHIYFTCIRNNDYLLLVKERKGMLRNLRDCYAAVFLCGRSIYFILFVVANNNGKSGGAM